MVCKLSSGTEEEPCVAEEKGDISSRVTGVRIAGGNSMNPRASLIRFTDRKVSRAGVYLWVCAEV
jgi:hypothetical protein